MWAKHPRFVNPFVDEDKVSVDLTQSGGKIEAAVEIEEKAFVDIVFTISSEYKVTEDGKDVYGIKDLLSNVGLVVNGEKMDDVVDLPDENWYQLALTGFAIPAGNVEVTLSNVSGKNSMMPKIRDVTFYSSQRLSLPDEEAADEKIISVCVNDPSMSGYNDISELPPHILDEIKHFFIVYKQLENKTTFVTEINGVEEAKRVIQASIDAYNDLYLK